MASGESTGSSTRRGSASSVPPSELSRPINLQRIAQRKSQIRGYNRTKKLEKLGVYSACKGVINFVLYKFGHLPQKEWQTMYDLAKMFLHCLNHWKLETPTARKQRAQTDDVSQYKVNYTRWLCYCHVPTFCDSLPRYETTQIFGRTLLRSVFAAMRRQLLEKFRAEKDKLPAEKRTLVLTHFPRFLSMLEEEVYGTNSPIWDPDFNQVPANMPLSSTLSAGQGAEKRKLEADLSPDEVKPAKALKALSTWRPSEKNN
uniref:PCAF N-terminal domain-containing protein n=1 Tax=Branchiostoma floridae TaxID=7739 RepID=C3XQF8_BRAFL|eukprot:XP_002613762.1 hypothetical protein BRAFLDRAFT_84518 [Branchiostoma floridae]